MVNKIKNFLNGIVLSFMGFVWNNVIRLLPEDRWGRYVFYVLIALFPLVGLYILLV